MKLRVCKCYCTHHSNLHLCQGSTFVEQFFVACEARASLEDLLLSKVLHRPHHKRCQNCHSKAPPEKKTDINLCPFTFWEGKGSVWLTQWLTHLAWDKRSFNLSLSWDHYVVFLGNTLDSCGTYTSKDKF